MSLEFRILGPLEFCGEDGGPLSLAGPKQRALLAVLLLNRNEAVTTDRLIDEVWSGAERSLRAPRANLQVYVSQLRKLLGDGRTLRSGAGGYSLVLEPNQLDAARFERLLGEGKAALARSRFEYADDRLREALLLWRGQPLADFAYASFAQAEIACLEELRLVALVGRIDADLALGRQPDLVGELELLVAEHLSASTCADSSCWRSTGRRGRPMLLRSTTTLAERSSKSWASSRARS